MRTLFIATNLLSFFARALKTSLNEEHGKSHEISESFEIQSEFSPKSSLANFGDFFVLHGFIAVREVVWKNRI
jgi:hypothetical protein